MRTRDVVIDREEAEFLVRAIKRYELSNGETDLSRLLARRFRRVRRLITQDDEPETAEAQQDIFSAGAVA